MKQTIIGDFMIENKIIEKTETLNLIEKTIKDLNESELTWLSHDTIDRKNELKSLNKGKLYSKEKYNVDYLVGENDFLYYIDKIPFDFYNQYLWERKSGEPNREYESEINFLKKDGDEIKVDDLILEIKFERKDYDKILRDHNYLGYYETDDDIHTITTYKGTFNYYTVKEGIFRKFEFNRYFSFFSSNYLLFAIETKKQEEKIEINEPCFLYLMEDLTNNLNKIGISNKPQFREKTLQSEKPQIVIVATKQYPSRKIALSFEKALHELYKEKRVRGEWFNLSDNERIEIIQTLQQ
ncbi:MAG: GIY-YIG nuclease family protein [Bacteroidales bacterium]|jgi:hypothetical protein